MGVLAVSNPYVLLGIMTRNEEGSLLEAQELVDTNLISCNGEYGALHLIEEGIHGDLSREISDIMSTDMLLMHDFHAGQVLHDQLYATILN